MVSATAAAAVPTITLKNDLLALQLDGRSVTRAQLLKYPQTRAPGSPPVVLFDADPAHFFAARSGWTGLKGNVEPVFQPETSAREAALADGANEVSAHFVATTAAGLQIRRTYSLPRGSYTLKAVSYTHLDVYKRQASSRDSTPTAPHPPPAIAPRSSHPDAVASAPHGPHVASSTPRRLGPAHAPRLSLIHI